MRPSSQQANKKKNRPGRDVAQADAGADAPAAEEAAKQGAVADPAAPTPDDAAATATDAAATVAPTGAAVVPAAGAAVVPAGAEPATPVAAGAQAGLSASVGSIAVGEPLGPRTLAIDIGGTGIKLLLLDAAGTPIGERRRARTPRPATPDAVLQVIDGLLPTEPYDRVSVGFPGVVVDGVIRTAPNLDPSFAGFDLQRELSQRTGRPVRVLNDAGVQGHGVIEGRGVEMLLTLGTGMGCALFVDGRYVPNIELAHHPFGKRRTYEQYIGDRARRRVGNRRWRRRVQRVIALVLRIFNPRVLYLGGGNARRLRFTPPEGVRITENVAGLLGGIALWR